VVGFCLDTNVTFCLIGVNRLSFKFFFVVMAGLCVMAIAKGVKSGVSSKGCETISLGISFISKPDDEPESIQK